MTFKPTRHPVVKNHSGSTSDRLCCVFNFAPHYRKEVFMRMEKEFGAAFFFGNRLDILIKKLDYTHLSQHPEELGYWKIFHSFNWLKGSVKLAFKPFRYYLLTGEPYCLSSWCLMVLNWLQGKKTYLWTHGWYGDETNVKRCIKKLYFKLSHGLFLYGNYARELMVKENFAPETLHVVYNSLQYTEQKKIRNTLKQSDIYTRYFNNHNPTIIFSGRLEKRKKLTMLLDAVSRLSGKLPLNLCFLGEGNDSENLRDYSARIGLEDRVWFYGACYDENVIADLIYNADVCVSPGEVGLTAMHALGYGTPVVTHNQFDQQMPEFEAIEDGSTGAFFAKDNVQNLCTTLETWFGRHPEKDKTLVNRCFQVIDQKYNPEFQIKMFKKIFN